MTCAKSTPATSTPTGRRLVELLVVTAPHVFVNRRDWQQIPAGQPGLEDQYDRGAILPAGLNPETATHLVRAGLVSRVIVRL